MAAIVVMVLVSILFSALLLNSEVRASIGRVIVQWLEQHTTITFNRGNAVSVEAYNGFDGLRPRILPEGFYEVSTITLGWLNTVVFANADGEEIVFEYGVARHFALDNENQIIENIVLHGNEAFLITAIDDEFYGRIIFTYEGMTVDIMGRLHSGLLIQITESVYVRH